jgi:hypothetical protein
MMERSNNRVGEGQRILWEVVEIYRLKMDNVTEIDAQVVKLKADL